MKINGRNNISHADWCNRCWKYNIELFSDQPLCPRCYEAVKLSGFNVSDFKNLAWHKIYEPIHFSMFHVLIPIETRRFLITEYQPFDYHPFLLESEIEFNSPLKVNEGGKLHTSKPEIMKKTIEFFKISDHKTFCYENNDKV